MPNKNQANQEESNSQTNNSPSKSTEDFDLGKVKNWDIVDTSDGSLMKKSQNSDNSSKRIWDINQEE